MKFKINNVMDFIIDVYLYSGIKTQPESTLPHLYKSPLCYFTGFRGTGKSTFSHEMSKGFTMYKPNARISFLDKEEGIKYIAGDYLKFIEFIERIPTIDKAYMTDFDEANPKKSKEVLSYCFRELSVYKDIYSFIFDYEPYIKRDVRVGVGRGENDNVRFVSGKTSDINTEYLVKHLTELGYPVFDFYDRDKVNVINVKEGILDYVKNNYVQLERVS